MLHLRVQNTPSAHSVGGHPPSAIFRDKIFKRGRVIPKNMFTFTLSTAQFWFVLFCFFCGGIGLPLAKVFFPLGRLVWDCLTALDPVWAHARITMPSCPPFISLISLAAVLILLLELFKSCNWTTDVCGTCQNEWCILHCYCQDDSVWDC